MKTGVKIAAIVAAALMILSMLYPLFTYFAN